MIHPSLVTRRSWLIPGLAIMALAALVAVWALAADPAERPSPRAFTPETGVDELLGKGGRAAHASVLHSRRYDGRGYKWAQYADWGWQLLTQGSVRNPPAGPAPSPLLSEHYRCIHCHNLAREDAKLTVQDPEAREKLILDSREQRPENRDGTVMFLATGATLWGSVNRDRFYNGYYTRYHDLTMADGSQMNPEKLSDAVVVCCRYCSVGRFPEQWELDSMLAYLWELEVRFKDLDVPADAGRQLLEQLRAADEGTRSAARKRLRELYLQESAATPGELPQRSEGDTSSYADGTSVTGAAKRGHVLYQSACAGCHGTSVHSMAGTDLMESDKRYHRFVLRGTERNELYMPFFTTERLSRRQIADIRAYLRSLK